MTIDLFFRDLADVHKEHAFCVILSGTGSDGAMGLSQIEEQGGVTLAQHPEDAEYEGMPQGAIATQMVDLVLPIVDMPHRLLDLWRNAQQIRTSVAPAMQPVPAPEVDEHSTAKRRSHKSLELLTPIA